MSQSSALTPDERAALIAMLKRMEIPDECCKGRLIRGPRQTNPNNPRDSRPGPIVAIALYCGCTCRRIPCRCPDPSIPLRCFCDTYRTQGACRCRPVYPKPCDCEPVFAACPHILSREHGTSLEEWAELLAGAYGTDCTDGEDGYGEPPAPPKRWLVKSQRGRMLVMARRHEDGYGLRHPLDAGEDEFDLIGIPLGQADNGRPLQLDPQLLGRDYSKACRWCTSRPVVAGEGLCVVCVTARDWRLRHKAEAAA
jgi:hypothetical protein